MSCTISLQHVNALMRRQPSATAYRRWLSSDKANDQHINNEDGKGRRLADNLEYCAKIVKERDYENFVAAMLMPKATRAPIISMLAVNAEVSVVRQKIKRNSGVAGIYQLQFWRDALRVWARQQKGILPRQPAISCLKEYGVPHEDIDFMLKLVEARQATLGDRPFRTLGDVEENAMAIHGSIIQLWANALIRYYGHAEELLESRTAFNEVADRVAKALGIANLMRSTLPLLKAEVVLLPEDRMSAFGLNPDIVFNNRKPDALRNMAVELCEISADHLYAARRCCADVDPRIRLALMSSAFRAEYITDILRANKGDLFATRLQQRHPFITWKMWWRNLRHVY